MEINNPQNENNIKGKRIIEIPVTDKIAKKINTLMLQADFCDKGSFVLKLDALEGYPSG